MEPYLGQIILFAGPKTPDNWVPCDGRTLSVSQYQALFSLIGVTYGGDGVNTFGIPDLRGRLPIGQGTGTGLTARALGQIGGTEQVTLDASQTPPHTHALQASTQQATSNDPSAKVLASVPAQHTAYFDPPNPLPTGVAAVQMATGSITSVGVVAAAHDNIMPSLAINYLICTLGLYPG